ncbi:hypothetical protein QUC32_29405 (plasmid) [Novosphingobium resinovorum]|uniref:Uncharacterized protein n=1 Tax=Novosphingobium resinovorum TaxID=158500 RepID=A0A1D8AFJ3_9SPHN|nr:MULTISPECIES: hypothetical protein [Novosphingobium]AOR80883.1 hypothetical protein BES08_29255 [Novosphingobium resinovorum]MBF7015098.1 hypothetical protein [Novosphingobium sp. HR1a]WJM29783.1 hypothetical protein QUC32_29405 [Novosphingobium resinovorum]
MTVAQNLRSVADLCRIGAKRTLDAQLALGDKPDDPVGALLWEQRYTRLQGQLNSLSALNSKLTAAAVSEGLKEYEGELSTIGEVSVAAQAKIKQIKEVSELLTKIAKVLDLGLALLAAAATPSPATIVALVNAGSAVADL